MKIKKLVRDYIGFLPVLLTGCIGWILDNFLNVEIWMIYWLLGFIGAFLSGGVLHYIDKYAKEERDEENEEGEEHNK